MYPVFLGAIFGMLSVALGAFGAHGLKSMIDKIGENGLANWETAVRYQFFHALALIFVGLLTPYLSSGIRTAVIWCFVIGILIFSGTLYALVLSGMRWLGAITPIGGTLMIIGWLLLAVAAWKAKI